MRLSLLKPLHAGWMVDLYNHMTGEAKKIIDSGWTSSGIKDAIRLGLNALPSIDPFNDIAPMMVEPNENPVLHNPPYATLPLNLNRSATQKMMMMMVTNPTKKMFGARQMTMETF